MPKFTATHTFDAPIEAVWAMFSDPDSHVEKFTSMGHRDLEVLESSRTDDHLHVVISRVVEVELPGFASKVLQPVNTVVSTDDWYRRDDGTLGGGFKLETKGAPVQIVGTTSCRADGDRSAYEVVLDVSVKVPIIGGKIADWAKGDINKQLEMEFAAGDAWLAGH